MHCNDGSIENITMRILQCCGSIENITLLWCIYWCVAGAVCVQPQSQLLTGGWRGDRPVGLQLVAMLVS